MRYLFLILIYCWVCSSPVYAKRRYDPSISYNSVDRIAYNVPVRYNNDLNKLTDYLINKAPQNDRMKVRVIFAWISYHILYDYYSYRQGEKNPQKLLTHYDTPVETFDKRSGVCINFAKLFTYMARRAGLNAVVVEGFAFGGRHAWNAVQIDGKWELLDSTNIHLAFRRVHSDGMYQTAVNKRKRRSKRNKDKLPRKIDDEYFLLDPKEMILSHFPEEDRWQLLNPPVSPENFLRHNSEYRREKDFIKYLKKRKLYAKQSHDLSISYNSVDRIAYNVPVRYNNDLNKLTDYLINKVPKDDRMKARVIFAWILYHILYDDYSYRQHQKDRQKLLTHDDTPFETFQKRRGTCGNFAKLFMYMARRAGLNAVVVDGFAFGGNHVWNAVQIDGKWELLDSTNSYKVFLRVQSDKVYEREAHEYEQHSKRSKVILPKTINDKYFLLDPKEMILSHFPKEDQWQLLNPPVSPENFLRHNSEYQREKDFIEYLEKRRAQQRHDSSSSYQRKKELIEYPKKRSSHTKQKIEDLEIKRFENELMDLFQKMILLQ